MTESSPNNLSAEFSAALQQAGIDDLTPDIQTRLETYCRLLWERNEVMNLTRHTTALQFVTRDLLDSWQLARLLAPGEQILDIGSGGGVPGLVLAILRPDLRITLSDSVKKKAKALEEFAAALELEVEVYDCRAESLLENFRYDSTVARAVGPLAKLLPLLRRDWVHVGRLLLLKGPRWQDELQEARRCSAFLDHALQLSVRAEYPIPGETWSSTILEIRPRREAHAD